MEEYHLNMKGNPLKKHQIDLFYKDMSLYHHPNILITLKLEREVKDKSHLFRCFTLMSLFAIALIKFSTEKIIKKSEKEFIEDINKKINELIHKLYGGREK